MEYKDYYKTMGVARDASADEIKKAYRKLARKYHPDVSKEPNAEARFKEINEAYEVLGDKNKRAAYDNLGSDWQAGQRFTPPPGWGGGEQGFTGRVYEGNAAQFSDFFESLFGQQFGFGRHQARSARQGFSNFQQRGEDVTSKLALTLEEAYQGGTKAISLQLPQRQGSASARTLNVKIPAGVMPGQRIRLAGQGLPGSDANSNGDLLLEIELLPHRLFRVEQRDVYLTLPITPWEAALGSKIAVPTLGGAVELKIPAGSQSGQKLRLKGRGLPGKTPGDQYITLKIVTPPANTPEAVDFYQKMSKMMPYNPRQ